jgi:hypothetical protein
VPWKNGLGISRAIADFPAGAGFDTVLWQVSATEIAADCPFSDLPGVDRQFLVIDGAGVELSSIDDQGKARTARVKPAQTPYAFRGDWKTDCRLLAGPVRVLNVMTRRGRFAADVWLSEGRTVKAEAGQILVAVDPDSLDGWRLDGPGSLAAPARAAIMVRIREA